MHMEIVYSEATTSGIVKLSAFQYSVNVLNINCNKTIMNIVEVKSRNPVMTFAQGVSMLYLYFANKILRLNMNPYNMIKADVIMDVSKLTSPRLITCENR